MPPALKALLAQLSGWALAFALARGGALPPGLWPLLAAQAAGATAVAVLLRAQRWWLPIHLAFSPLLVLAHGLGIAPGWYLATFLLLVAIYWTSFRTQVPLFLSNRATATAVAALLPSGRPAQVLDIGSGLGSLLRPLARQRPDCRFTGVEAAPGPYWLSRLLGRGTPNLHMQRGDFFRRSWADYDLVYAFLSPVPMAEVWRKAVAEMRPGSALVSNSFAVPGVEAAQTIDVADARRTRLFVYRLPAHPTRRKAK